MSDLTCPVCLSERVNLLPSTGAMTHYHCDCCDKYSISRTAEKSLRAQAPTPALSAWIRSHHEDGRKPPELNSYTLKEILKSLPQYSPLEKQTLLLRSIERQTKYPGYKVQLNPDTDYPLAWAALPDEFVYLLNSLQDRGLIQRYEISSGPTDKVIIRSDGWDYLDKLDRHPGFSDQVFVAMWFDEEMDEAWEKGIKPAIEKADLKPIRVDKEAHIDRIDAKIIADIRDSKFVVADVTGQRQGVYFEAGYAIGLGRPVIWCVRKNNLEQVHFDTRQYNHIVWETVNDLREQLYQMIRAVI